LIRLYSTTGGIAALAAVFATAPALPARAADWQAGASPPWQQVLAAAKKEGRVAVAGPPELAEPFAQGFSRDTGIAVDYLGGEARTTASRVIRELRAGIVTIDVFFTGSAELPQVKEGLFDDEKSRLLLPGVTDPANWSGGTLKWVDNTQQFMLQTHAYISTVPIYDGNSVKPGELTSWKDLLKPQFKGKIVVYDPRSGGPGMQVAGYVGSQFGMDFLKSLYLGQAVVYSLDSRQMAEWVARGVDTVGLGIPAADFTALRDAGITNLVAADPKDGPGTLTGGFSVVELPKGGPHPNAATVFLNWYASQPGQEIYSKAMKSISRRTDVPVDPSIPAYTVPKPGIAYQDQYNENWLTNVRAAVAAQVLDVIGGK
jgi:ABC-type Fe3+ transport system substrate-binding protein